ncbi:hypothetical protein [Burkholderia pseudomallei]|uniref:hypothetical protein n=1 Tax=Burkholderia pseudomallei TaxID=28450 RepID=UPI0009777BF0|nr:hypothetical protein [Burkholderia pseudomallei]MBO2982837.1 hypothetical protein [Burkholderia pseudomallei]MBO7785997.1 hypothetical protein [Burkholderia pseudomallei]MBO7915019.1 hypothetical protein [Burkholderia pseudomallei]MCV9981310.1 hypothetical protein [Burkholderia pseudomallei]MCV9987503.1 hypothetical protein [Burkholderia pseudomallei]
MKLLRDARSLKSKAISSLRRGLSAFNSYEEDGRITAVLLHLQHACEMLVKAALIQARVSIFDKKTGTSLGFAKCLNLSQTHCGVTDEEAGTMRAIDSLRDAEQHWMVVVSEQLLFMHVRALVTILDDILKRSFEDELITHLPQRVLPVSTAPIASIDVLMDREYSQIYELLSPGRRARDEARGRIRALLAMESHVANEVEVSEKDIDRIEKAIRGKKPFVDVFPRLTAVGTSANGEGIELKVHFTKKQGAPVKYVDSDDPAEAAAVREFDLRKKYHLGRQELAKAVGLTHMKAAVLRKFLKIDEDPSSCHIFEFGKSKFPCYSDNALRAMKDALKEYDIDELWRARAQ